MRVHWRISRAITRVIASVPKRLRERWIRRLANGDVRLVCLGDNEADVVWKDKSIAGIYTSGASMCLRYTKDRMVTEFRK